MMTCEHLQQPGLWCCQLGSLAVLMRVESMLVGLLLAEGMLAQAMVEATAPQTHLLATACPLPLDLPPPPSLPCPPHPLSPLFLLSTFRPEELALGGSRFTMAQQDYSLLLLVRLSQQRQALGWPLTEGVDGEQGVAGAAGQQQQQGDGDEVVQWDDEQPDDEGDEEEGAEGAAGDIPDR